MKIRLLALFAILLAYGPAMAHAADKPNILLLLSDEHSFPFIRS